MAGSSSLTTARHGRVKAYLAVTEASVVGLTGEIDDVSESDEAVDGEDDADVTSVAARVKKIELSEQAVAAPPEPHAESRAKRAISEVASGSGEDSFHPADEGGRPEIRDDAGGKATAFMSLATTMTTSCRS